MKGGRARGDGRHQLRERSTSKARFVITHGLGQTTPANRKRPVLAGQEYI